MTFSFINARWKPDAQFKLIRSVKLTMIKGASAVKYKPFTITLLYKTDDGFLRRNVFWSWINNYLSLDFGFSPRFHRPTSYGPLIVACDKIVGVYLVFTLHIKMHFVMKDERKKKIIMRDSAYVVLLKISNTKKNINLSKIHKSSNNYPFW